MFKEIEEVLMVFIDIEENLSVIIKAKEDSRKVLISKYRNKSRREFRENELKLAEDWLRSKKVGEFITKEHVGNSIYFRHTPNLEPTPTTTKEHIGLFDLFVPRTPKQQKRNIDNMWDEFNSMIESMIEIRSQTETLDERLNTLSEELSRLDRVVNDLEHVIEFSNYNVVQGYDVYKKLRETLTARRKVKDMWNITSQLKGVNLSGINKVINSYERLDDRHYKFRELNEEDMEVQMKIEQL